MRRHIPAFRRKAVRLLAYDRAVGAGQQCTEGMIAVRPRAARDLEGAAQQGLVVASIGRHHGS